MGSTGAPGRLGSGEGSSAILPHFPKSPTGSIRGALSQDTTAQYQGQGIMPTVRVKENEPFEVAMRRFKRTVEKTGLLTELRAREFYEKTTSERKRKIGRA